MFKAFIYLLFSISVSSALHCNDGTVRGVNLGGWLVVHIEDCDAKKSSPLKNGFKTTFFSSSPHHTLARKFIPK